MLQLSITSVTSTYTYYKVNREDDTICDHIKQTGFWPNFGLPIVNKDEWWTIARKTANNTEDLTNEERKETMEVDQNNSIKQEPTWEYWKRIRHHTKGNNWSTRKTVGKKKSKKIMMNAHQWLKKKIENRSKIEMT